MIAPLLFDFNKGEQKTPENTKASNIRGTPSRTYAYYHKAAGAEEGPRGYQQLLNILDRYTTAMYRQQGRYQGSI